MIEDEVVDPDEEEEEEEEQTGEREQSPSEAQQLLDVLLPPVTDEELESLDYQSVLLPSPGQEMIGKIVAAIMRGAAERSDDGSIENY